MATGFVACGVSGCSGGGFGPVYAPVKTQIGLLVSGALLVPLAVYLLRAGRPLVLMSGGLAVWFAGALLLMLLLGLGPDGCPVGRSQAPAGPEDMTSGSITCAADPRRR